MTQVLGAQSSAATCSVLTQDASMQHARKMPQHHHHLEHDFFVMSRGPKLLVHGIDLDSGFDIARRASLHAPQASEPNRVVFWLSDKLKKDSFSLRYTIGDLIDEGTYAKVYHCTTNDKHQTRYAVKVMNKQQMISLGMLPYLRREVAILKKIRHVSGVCRFIDFVETGDMVYLVLELLHGGSLDREFCYYEESDVRVYMYQVAKTLKCLHTLGIFHADLQLGNIVKMNKDAACQKVKLVDFGLSDYCSNGDKKHFRFVGNLYYASPEMLSQQKYDGPEIDIWALGVCLFRMATGYRPFKDADAIVNGNFMIPLEDEDDLSEECKDLIVQILQVDPAKRPTIDQILAHSFFDACRETLDNADNTSKI